VCAGIEAASAAWEPLGWEAAWFSEIEAFPRAVLAHHYPGVCCLGDFTAIRGRVLRRLGLADTVDVLIGGTPCQSFSVAGKRAGLDDPRGNLALEFVRLAGRLRARWVVWENVPGVLSSNGGADFAEILSAYTGCRIGVPPGGWRNGGIAHGPGYGLAWRVLDAQYFGVPQRRRRVFLVGYSGDWRPAAAVLFEPDCLRGDIAPGGEAEEIVAALSASGVGTCGADDNQGQGGHLIAHALNSRQTRFVGTVETLVSAPLTGNAYADRAAEEANLITPIAFECKATEVGSLENLSSCLRSMGHRAGNQNGGGQVAVVGAITKALGEGGYATDKMHNYVPSEMGVRRLTPRECERLQGFPDDYTLIRYRGRPAADGPRYRALGNSMAVPVIRWIGERIAAVEEIIRGK